MEKRDLVRIVSEHGTSTDFTLEGTPRSREGTVLLEITESGIKRIDSWPFPAEAVRAFAEGREKVLSNGSGLTFSDDSEGQRAKVEFIWDPHTGRTARGYMKRDEVRRMLMALVGQ